MEDVEKLRELVSSGEKTNIEIAFMLAEHFDEKVQKDLFELWVEIVGGGITSKYLMLSKTGIDYIPKAVKFYTELTGFHAFGNKFKEFPLELIALPNLKLIDLYCNYIIAISDDIKKLKNLKRLDLRYNFLKDSEMIKLKEWFPDCSIGI